MGFGQWFKDTFVKVKNWVNGAAEKVRNVVNKITTAAKPYVGAAADIVGGFNPGLGQAIKTGFNLADGISGVMKRGGIKGGIQGGIGAMVGGPTSILNRSGREPPEVCQEQDDDDDD
jgi:hypothetical protein